MLDDCFNREVDTALEIHRVHAGGYRLAAFAHNRCGQNGRGGGAVAGLIGSPRGHFAHHLCAHVLELVFELDFLGDRDTVLGDARGAERLVEHDVTALGAEGNPHRVGEDVDTVQHAVAGIDGEFDVFSSHCSDSLG